MADKSQPPDDYDLEAPLPRDSTGLRQGLPSYGDAHFPLFLRKVFIKGLRYSEDALSIPIVGIVNTYSSFNPCHATVPQLMRRPSAAASSSRGFWLSTFPLSASTSPSAHRLACTCTT